MAVKTIPIKRGQLQSYNDLPTKDAGTIYVAFGETVDENAIFWGDDLVVKNFEPENTLKNVSFNSTTFVITFTYLDDTTYTIDLPTESLIRDIDYDSDTHELTITLVSGATTTIDLSDLIDVYTPADTDTVSMDITSGVISAEVKISEDMTNAITAKADGIHASKPSVIDSDTVRMYITSGHIASAVIVDSTGDNILTASADGVKVDPAFVITDEATNAKVATEKAVADALVFGTF